MDAEKEGILEPVKTPEEQAARKQSKRIKDQGLGDMNIADKAQALKKKHNLEGNPLKFVNSFAVLSKTELILRSCKMGLDMNNVELDHFDIMKDLEMASANLNQKSRKTYNHKLRIIPLLFLLKRSN